MADICGRWSNRSNKPAFSNLCGVVRTAPKIKPCSTLKPFERVTYVSVGLVAIGCEPSQKTFIGVLFLNCFSFSLCVYVQASMSFSLLFILAELSTIVCNEDKVSLLLEQAHSCKGLKNLVKIGSQVTKEQSDKAKGLGLKLISLADLEVSCALNILRH